MKNFEYKIIDLKIMDAQKVLNQWKHDYIVKIISMNSYVAVITGVTYVTILLTRERNGR